MLTTRTAWFPLRSNIAYFETTGPSLDIKARVKEMAMLSDELLFEPGLLDVTISDSGSWDMHIPISQLSEEDVRKRREVVNTGEPVGFFIGPEAVPGQPAPPEAMQQIIGGKLARSFVAEYHLLAQESGLEDQPWVHFGLPNPDLELVAKEVTRGLEHNAFFEKRRMPALSGNTWLDEYLRKGLNIDIGRGAALEMPVMLDQLHAPILQYRAEHADAEQRPEPIPGAEALHLWAPNFTGLEWKDIIKLHEHEAIGEFRVKLVEAEATVAGLPDDERRVALKDIGYQAALDALRAKATKWRDLGLDLAMESVVDLIPYGGLAYSTITGGAKVLRDKSEWTAILLLSTRAREPPKTQIGRPAAPDPLTRSCRFRP
jgi:hypothetical protein